MSVCNPETSPVLCSRSRVLVSLARAPWHCPRGVGCCGEDKAQGPRSRADCRRGGDTGPFSAVSSLVLAGAYLCPSGVLALVSHGPLIPQSDG